MVDTFSPAGHRQNNIASAVLAIGKSRRRALVFEAIYFGRSKAKSVSFLAKKIGIPRQGVLDAGVALVRSGCISQTKSEKEGIAYGKVTFYQSHKDKILSMVRNPEKLKSFPTSYNPAGGASGGKSILIKFGGVNIKADKKKISAEELTIDDIDSFKKVRMIREDLEHERMPETVFKRGIGNILGTRDVDKDWGGEQRDLSTTRLRISGTKRHFAVFAFKGPGMTGKLVPGKMGKNGDQIQRLARCDADAYFVQYWGNIDDSVREQLACWIKLKASTSPKTLYFGIIDGSDSARIIKAYPDAFKGRGR